MNPAIIVGDNKVGQTSWTWSLCLIAKSGRGGLGMYKAVRRMRVIDSAISVLDLHPTNVGLLTPLVVSQLVITTQEDLIENLLDLYKSAWGICAYAL